MSLIIFLVGFVVFILFTISLGVEIKDETKQNEIDWNNYYERHSIQRKKEPKRKQGSQSRRKNYFWKK